jgi:hypothetical protein
MSPTSKVAILGAILCGAIFYGWKLFGSGGLTDQKAIYAIMQAIELDYRYKVISTPFLIEESSIRLVAVASEDKNFPYIWIALNRINPTDPDGVYKVGTSRPKKISCAEVATVLRQPSISESAKAFLRRNCSESPR